MKDKVESILYYYFGWQRKFSIEKATEHIQTELEKELVNFVVWLADDNFADIPAENLVKKYLLKPENEKI